MKRQRLGSPEYNPNQKPLCKFFLSGRCTKSQCTYRHDSNNRLENINRRKLQERRERNQKKHDKESFPTENSELEHKLNSWMNAYHQMEIEKSVLQEKAKCDRELMYEELKDEKRKVELLHKDINFQKEYLKTETRSWEKSVSKLNQKNFELQEKHEDLQNRAKYLQIENESLKKSFEAMKLRNNMIKTELDVISDNYKVLKTSLTEKDAQYDIEVNQAMVSKNKIESLMESMDEMKNEKEVLEQKCESLQIQRMEKEQDAYNEEVLELKDRLNQQTNQINFYYKPEIDSLKKSKEIEIKRLKNSRNEVRSEKNKYMASCETLSKKIEVHEQKCKILEKSIQEMGAEKNSLYVRYCNQENELKTKMEEWQMQDAKNISDQMEMKQKCKDQAIEIDSLKLSMKSNIKQCKNCDESEVTINLVKNEIKRLNKSRDELKNEKDKHVALGETLSKNVEELKLKYLEATAERKRVEDLNNEIGILKGVKIW